MMKEKINDTEPGIKQIEREIERGCDNAKKYFWLFVVFFAAGLIVRNVMHDFFSAGIDSWKADPELNNFRYMWNTLMYVIPIMLYALAAVFLLRLLCRRCANNIWGCPDIPAETPYAPGEHIKGGQQYASH